MKFNITEPMARVLVGLNYFMQTEYEIDKEVYPLLHRIGEVFPHLKAEYSYLDWAKFNESKGE